MNELNPQLVVQSFPSPNLLPLSATPPVVERRETPRFEVAAEVRFVRSGAEAAQFITGDVQDASLKGMRAILDQPVRKGEVLQIDVRTKDHGQFQIDVQIMWVEVAADGRFISGCEFCSILTLKQRAQLQRLAEVAVSAGRRAAV